MMKDKDTGRIADILEELCRRISNLEGKIERNPVSRYAKHIQILEDRTRDLEKNAPDPPVSHHLTWITQQYDAILERIRDLENGVTDHLVEKAAQRFPVTLEMMDKRIRALELGKMKKGA
jgi:uncharacterized membrane protein YccC